MLLGLSALLVAAQDDSSARQRLDALLDRHLVAEWRADPEGASGLGRREYDSLSTDLTVGALARAAEHRRSVLAGLYAIDTAALDVQGQVDWLLFEGELVAAERAAARRPEARVPSRYIRFGGVYTLLEDETRTVAERVVAAAARLERWPAAFATGRRQLERPPHRWTELAIGSAPGIARYLRETALSKVAGASPDALARFLRARDAAVVALEAYATWLADSLRPRSTGDWAAGTEYYDFLLRRAKLLPFTAESLIALGHRVMAETEDSLAALARRIDTRRTWRQLAESSKALHPPADSILAAYARETERALRFLARRGLIERPPGETLHVVFTPPNLRSTYAYGGYDAPGPFATRKIGRFFVTPVESWMSPEQVTSKLRGHNYGWITVVAVHEGYPGHHLQYMYAFTNPSLFRRLYGSEVFTEGWGLYAEELMYREGFYESPLARLTQLRMRLWRAARVVLDPSLHTGRMSYDEAVNFFVERVGLERPDAEAEVTRYTTWPSQAVSYIVGMQEIERLRDEIDPADLRAFHRILLSQGSLPPALMRRAVRAAYGLEG